MIALLFAFLALATDAVAKCELPALRTDERPNAHLGPTELTVSIIVADILGVDDVNQQIELDMFVRLIWDDPRLEGLEGCRFQRTQVWGPDLYVYNSSNLRRGLVQARDQVVIKEDGTVSYRQRLSGMISTYHSLRRYPMDSHDFEIAFGPLNSSTEELTFKLNEEDTWISDRLNIEGWHVTGIGLKTEPVFREEDGREVSTGTLTISAERDQSYYRYRIMLPLFFVVAMSWCIFWVPPSRFEFQMGLGATSMLTIIATKLAASSNLPKLGYLTALDKLLIWAIVLVFLAMAEALVTGLLVRAGREDQALRLDRASRVAAPLLLVLGFLVVRADLV